MPNSLLLEQINAEIQRRWNALVPRHAVCVQNADRKGLRWLHPTKGWRKVSYRRLGIIQ